MFMYICLHPLIYNTLYLANIFQRVFLNLCWFMISCKSPRIFWSKWNTPQVWEEHYISVQINQHVTPLLICPVQQFLPTFHKIRKYISYLYKVKALTRLFPFQMSPPLLVTFFSLPPSASCHLLRKNSVRTIKNYCNPKLYTWVALPSAFWDFPLFSSTKGQCRIKNSQSFWLLDSFVCGSSNATGFPHWLYSYYSWYLGSQLFIKFTEESYFFLK